MSYESLLIGILVIVLLVIAAYHLLSSSQPERKLWRDERGKLIAVGERAPGESGEFHGRGTHTTEPLKLAAGRCRIDYQFDAPTRLALVSSGDEETLLIKSGVGSAEFEVAEAGRYRLLVEPAEAGAAWQINYRQTGT